MLLLLPLLLLQQLLMLPLLPKFAGRHAFSTLLAQ
jgi:hypothetical protein